VCWVAKRLDTEDTRKLWPSLIRPHTGQGLSICIHTIQHSKCREEGKADVLWCPPFVGLGLGSRPSNPYPKCGLCCNLAMDWRWEQVWCLPPHLVLLQVHNLPRQLEVRSACTRPQ
jgi:hypothetical protein